MTKYINVKKKITNNKSSSNVVLYNDLHDVCFIYKF